MLIDTHTHLDSFARRGELPTILQRAGSVLLYIAGMNALPHREALLARLTGAGRGKSDARTGAEDEADRNVLIRLQFQSDDELLQRLVGQFGGG